MLREEIAREMARSKIPFVLQRRDGGFQDLTHSRVSKFDDQPYAVHRRPHEILVIDHQICPTCKGFKRVIGTTNLGDHVNLECPTCHGAGSIDGY